MIKVGKASRKILRWIFWGLDALMVVVFIFALISGLESAGEKWYELLFFGILLFFIVGYMFLTPLYLLSYFLSFMHGFKEVESLGDFIVKLIVSPVIVIVRVVTRLMVIFKVPQSYTRTVLCITKQIAIRTYTVIFELSIVAINIFSFTSMLSTNGLIAGIIVFAIISYILSAVGMLLNAAFSFAHGMGDYEDVFDFLEGLRYAPVTFAINTGKHILGLFGYYYEYDNAYLYFEDDYDDYDDDEDTTPITVNDYEEEDYEEYEEEEEEEDGFVLPDDFDKDEIESKFAQMTASAEASTKGEKDIDIDE